jgi:hypothetical protein
MPGRRIAVWRFNPASPFRLVGMNPWPLWRWILRAALIGLLVVGAASRSNIAVTVLFAVVLIFISWLQFEAAQRRMVKRSPEKV